MGKAMAQVCRVYKNKPLEQLFPVHWGGWAGGIPKDSCRVETAHGEARGQECDLGLGAVAPDPWLTFPWELGTVTEGSGSHWHSD